MCVCVYCLQKEEGLIQGQLNHSDSKQYITQLRQEIAELKNEVRFFTHTHTHTQACASMQVDIFNSLCTRIVFCDQKKMTITFTTHISVAKKHLLYHDPYYTNQLSQICIYSYYYGTFLCFIVCTLPPFFLVRSTFLPHFRVVL